MTAPGDGSQLQQVSELLAGRRVVALTGAGMSTDSGIPDYRGPGSPVRTPMTYDVFCSGGDAQRRYWARAYIGWQRMGAARPNAGHHALAALERHGTVTALVTQNVDGLHTAAGHRRVIDLHGRVSEVVCLDCRAVSSRASLQRRLRADNQSYGIDRDVQMAPDGDAIVNDTAGFRVPTCEGCGGRLKPHVVFFGENVPRERVAEATALVDDADVVLVAGSSLTVMSGFRFVRQAARSGTTVVIINRGPTRGDDLADVRVDGGCSQVLSALASQLAPLASATP